MTLHVTVTDVCVCAREEGIAGADHVEYGLTRDNGAVGVDKIVILAAPAENHPTGEVGSCVARHRRTTFAGPTQDQPPRIGPGKITKCIEHQSDFRCSQRLDRFVHVLADR